MSIRFDMCEMILVNGQACGVVPIVPHLEIQYTVQIGVKRRKMGNTSVKNIMSRIYYD